MTPADPRGEFALIDAIRSRTPMNARVAMGIGDDCAAIRATPGREILVTTDMLMDGRHFRVGVHPLPAIGRKCLGVNLSDVAAMAGVPIAAVVAVALPRDDAENIAVGLHAGIAAIAAEYDVAIVGGDTNAWDGPLVVSITVLGETTERGAVTRSGAKPGDVLLVTGPLGGSILGRHLDPQPRIAEALAIHQVVDVHAMIDLSDGLAGDLIHIIRTSGGVGALLDADLIPIHPDAHTLADRDGASPLDHALGDGEDFELCLAVDPRAAERLVRDFGLRRIGVIDDGPGVRIKRGGLVTPSSIRGFDHLGAS